MKLNERVLSDVLGTLYDAAASPEHWPAFLKRLEEITEAEQAGVLLHDSAFRDHSIASQVDMDPDYQQAYIDHYAKTDIWYQRSRNVVYPGWVGPSQSLVSDAELLKSEFYNDLLRPYGMFNEIGVVLEENKDQTFVITLLRSRKAGAFGDPHVRLLKLLVPHLRRAFQLSRHMNDLRQHGAAMQWALDSWSTGLILLNQSGQPIFLNRAAAHIMEQRDGLDLSRNRLTATYSVESRRLEKLLAVALGTSNGHNLHPAGAVQIHRARSDRPLTLLVSPFRAGGPFVALSQPAVAVFISDPEQQARPCAQVLKELYSLTAAEVELALLLGAGKTLKEAAAERKITLETARTQLKSIFSKTNTRRQSELIRLLLLIPR